VFQRKGSPYWQLWLGTARKGSQQESTKILIGTTVSQRHDSKRLAELLYHRRMVECGKQVHQIALERPAIRFSAYAVEYEDAISAHKGAIRERDLVQRLLTFFADDRLTTIDQARVRQYWSFRRKQRIPRTERFVSHATVNREVDFLKAMLRDAVPRYLENNPLAGMKRLKTVPLRRRVLTPDEESRLLKVTTDPQERAVLILGIDTLVRLNDLLDLQRTDRDGRWLWIKDPKNGEPHSVPLSPRAAVALDRIGHDAPYYFEKFRRAMNPRDWPSAVRKRLMQLCADAKVPYGQLEGGIVFHSATRKTGATRLLLDRQVPVAVVQDLGNWKTPDVLLKVYTEVRQKDLLAAVGWKAGKGRKVAR
jgi:integrase